MKKVFISLLSFILVLSIVGCTKKEDPVVDPNTPENSEAGGWVEKDEEITSELQEIFDKAVGGLMGVTYKPLKLIGTQVVAGTNYKFLASATTVTETPIVSTKIVTIYKDLEGNVEVTNIEDYEVFDPVLGGWTQKEEELTDELKTIFEKATADLLGATYEPVKLVATQVVAGTNYRFLANVTTVTQTPVTKECYVTIYVDLQGNVKLLTVEEMAK